MKVPEQVKLPSGSKRPSLSDGRVGWALLAPPRQHRAGLSAAASPPVCGGTRQPISALAQGSFRTL